MRLKLLTLIEPALLPACVCTFRRTWLKLQTLFEPASLPQFQLCGTYQYCVEAAQLLVMLSFTDTVNPGKLLPQLDGDVSTHCLLVGIVGICVKSTGEMFDPVQTPQASHQMTPPPWPMAWAERQSPASCRPPQLPAHCSHRHSGQSCP